MQFRGMQCFRQILDAGPNQKVSQPVVMHFHRICSEMGCIYRGSTVKGSCDLVAHLEALSS